MNSLTELISKSLGEQPSLHLVAAGDVVVDDEREPRVPVLLLEPYFLGQREATLSK